jgi:hypothetical protein
MAVDMLAMATMRFWGQRTTGLDVLGSTGPTALDRAEQQGMEDGEAASRMVHLRVNMCSSMDEIPLDGTLHVWLVLVARARLGADADMKIEVVGNGTLIEHVVCCGEREYNECVVRSGTE